MNEFERVASEADDGLPSDIGTMRRLLDEGRLKAWVIAYSYTKDGATGVHYRSCDDTPAAIGLAEWTRHALLTSFEDTEPE